MKPQGRILKRSNSKNKESEKLTNILKVINVVQPTLGNQESIVRITLADVLSALDADYCTRYKVKSARSIGKRPHGERRALRGRQRVLEHGECTYR
jgi:hypothetical protein